MKQPTKAELRERIAKLEGKLNLATEALRKIDGMTADMGSTTMLFRVWSVCEEVLAELETQ